MTASRAAASIDRTFAELATAVESFDQLMTGAEAKCRCGNYSDAELMLTRAIGIGRRLALDLTSLHSRVVAAEAFAALG